VASLCAIANGVDLIDAVLVLAVAQANISRVTADPDLQRRFADAASIPDDSHRRPISVSALAASLGLPFETVRRRLGRLAAADLCEASPGGYWVPARLTAIPPFSEAPSRIYGLLSDLHHRLADQDLLPETPSDQAAPWTEPPLRLAARLAGDFILRLLELLHQQTLELVDSVLVVAVFDAAPPGRAASAAAVARNLSLPHETTRRHMKKLEASGHLQRIRGGWRLSGAGLDVVRRSLGSQDALADVRRLFASLARYGVVDLWRAAT